MVNKQLIGQVIDRLWQVANELDKDKDNEHVIERLKESCWYVVCNSTAEVNLILQFCKKVGIGWRSGDVATKFKPNETYPLCIIFCNYDQSIMYVKGDSGDYSEKNGYENITSWIFNAIRGENNG